MRRTYLCRLRKGFERADAESALNGHAYQMHGVCQHSLYGYTDTIGEHTTGNWKPFMRDVHSDAKRAGHDPKVFISSATARISSR